jgi:hypothetical protein
MKGAFLITSGIDNVIPLTARYFQPEETVTPGKAD